MVGLIAPAFSERIEYADHEIERMVNLWEQARQEAYEYYRKKIGDFKTDRNNDVDAFQHASVSAVFTLHYGEQAAAFLGRLNEIRGGYKGQTEEERVMDEHNNKIGRQIGSRLNSELAKLKKSGLVKNNQNAHRILLADTRKRLDDKHLGTSLIKNFADPRIPGLRRDFGSNILTLP